MFLRRLRNRNFPGLLSSRSWSRFWPDLAPPLFAANSSINYVLGVWLPSHVPVRQR